MYRAPDGHQLVAAVTHNEGTTLTLQTSSALSARILGNSMGSTRNAARTRDNLWRRCAASHDEARCMCPDAADAPRRGRLPHAGNLEQHSIPHTTGSCRLARAILCCNVRMTSLFCCARFHDVPARTTLAARILQVAPSQKSAYLQLNAVCRLVSTPNAIAGSTRVTRDNVGTVQRRPSRARRRLASQQNPGPRSCHRPERARNCHIRCASTTEYTHGKPQRVPSRKHISYFAIFHTQIRQKPRGGSVPPRTAMQSNMCTDMVIPRRPRRCPRVSREVDLRRPSTCRRGPHPGARLRGRSAPRKYPGRVEYACTTSPPRV